MAWFSDNMVGVRAPVLERLAAACQYLGDQDMRVDVIKGNRS